MNIRRSIRETSNSFTLWGSPIENQDDDQKKIYKDTYYHAIKLLTSKDYSVHKLKTKLTEKKFPKDIVEIVIQELLDKNYLKEELYAGARVKGFMHKGYSINYIVQKLAQEKVVISKSEVEDIFSEYRFSEFSQIQYLIEKKSRSKSIEAILDSNFKEKLLRFLLSKGHNYSSCEKIISDFIRSKKDEAWAAQ